MEKGTTYMVRPRIDPRHVARVRSGEVGVWPLRVRELLERAGLHERGAEAVVLLGAAVAPVDRVGLGERRHLGHPLEELCVGGRGAGRLSHGGWRVSPLVNNRASGG